ncbi:hypothetical protein [Aureivirga sp. CE67]|uniref:hypothetical protein n=1 Tax=Aureivirga sp. CE67 TaxID=1788983 RepID=UPI0018C9434B|nr:hypothetical protein [Aureivirga sp. CE67]
MNFVKITLKTFYIIAILFTIFFIINYIFKENWSWIYILIVSFVFSGTYIGSNIFDYDFYNDMDTKDYLETNHESKINFSDNNWNKLKNIEEIKEYPCIKIEEKKDSIKYKIKTGFIVSLIEFKKENNQIISKIHKKYFGFIPDKALNYKILRNISHQLS